MSFKLRRNRKNVCKNVSYKLVSREYRFESHRRLTFSRPLSFFPSSVSHRHDSFLRAYRWESVTTSYNCKYNTGLLFQVKLGLKINNYRCFHSLFQDIATEWKCLFANCCTYRMKIEHKISILRCLFATLLF